MDEQTRKLLEECSSGCRMAVDSFRQVREYAEDTNLIRLIDDYTEKHRQLEDEAASLLKEAGKPEKEPGVMATTIWGSKRWEKRQTSTGTPTERLPRSRKRSSGRKKS